MIFQKTRIILHTAVLCLRRTKEKHKSSKYKFKYCILLLSVIRLKRVVRGFLSNTISHDTNKARAQTFLHLFRPFMRLWKDFSLVSFETITLTR